jgi:hypothetical protein
MGQKKKTTSTRKATYAKAGDKRRKPHVPVMRQRTLRRRDGSTFEVTEESPSHMRRGPGSNREEAYTGYPTSYYR